MSRGSPGSADIQLAEEVSKRLQRDISPRQIERWRERGLLPNLTREGRGRGLGSKATYPEGAVEHAAALASAVTEFGRLDEAALACLIRQFTPREVGLRWAYRAWFERLRKAMEHKAGSSDPWDVAEVLGGVLARRSGQSPAAREMRERLRKDGKGASLSDVLTNSIAVMLGAGAQWHADTFQAAGATGLYRDRLGEIGPIVEGPPSALPELTLTSLEELATGASFDELIAARADLLSLRDFSRAFASTTRRTLAMDFGFGAIADLLADDLMAALIGLPVMVIARRSHPESVDETMQVFREETPKYEAHTRLLDSLNEKHQRMVGLGAEGLAVLSDDDRERFSHAVREWADAHPDDMELIVGVS